MINLLPDNAKKELRAARANVTLLNYMLILGLSIAFLAFICAAVYFVLIGTKTAAENLMSENSSKSTSYSSVQAQGAALRASLSSAQTILNQEVVYTKVITGIAALVPSGVVLDSLNLTPDTFGKPTTLKIFAKSTEDALALKNNFQSSPLFSDITFQALNPGTDQSSVYPVTATLNLTINKSAAQ